MTVGYISAEESVRTGTGDPHTFAATLPSSTRGIVLMMAHGTSATDHAAATATVTFGGKRMSKITSADCTSAEPGRVDIWFLGHDLPAAGAQTLSVDLASATGDDIAFWLAYLSGSADLEPIALAAVPRTGVGTNPTTGAMAYGGRTAMAFGVLYSGLPNVGDNAPNANMSAIHDHDPGAFVMRCDRQTTAGSADFTLSYTSGSDDYCLAAVAISEELPNSLRERMIALAPDGMWLLNEPVGCLAAIDRSANCNHAPYTVAPTLAVAGPTASGLTGATFNGTTQYAQVPAGLVPAVGTNDYTIATWLLDASWPGASSWLVGWTGDGDANDDVELYQNSSANVLSSRVVNGVGTNATCSSGTATKNDGAWHHAAVVADRDGSVSFYLDAVLDGTPTSVSGGSAVNVTSLGSVWIGRRLSSGFAAVSLHGVLIKRAALTLDQVASIAGTLKIARMSPMPQLLPQ